MVSTVQRYVSFLLFFIDRRRGRGWEELFVKSRWFNVRSSALFWQAAVEVVPVFTLLQVVLLCLVLQERRKSRGGVEEKFLKLLFCLFICLSEICCIIYIYTKVYVLFCLILLFLSISCTRCMQKKMFFDPWGRVKAMNNDVIVITLHRIY